MAKVDLKKRAAARRAVAKNKTSDNDFIVQRAQARKALLDTVTNQDSLDDRARARRAYMQGGPGPNDPKALGYPGELKYPRMEVPVGGDSRQWEENWFMGAAEVTKQKMGPSGVELELKKKMQRASVELRGLDKQAQNDPEKARLLAAKIANDLNSVVEDMDKAGYLKAAQESDEILEKIAEFIASPVEAAKKDEKLSVKAELADLADTLDRKGFTQEADEIDQVLSQL